MRVSFNKAKFPEEIDHGIRSFYARQPAKNTQSDASWEQAEWGANRCLKKTPNTPNIANPFARTGPWCSLNAISRGSGNP
jgi:hypothetical protein